MTIRYLAFSSLAVLASLTLAKPAWSEPVEVTIDAGQQSAPVSPHIYGMFIEPIGNLVGRSLWAEMLDDRKFQADVLPASVDPDPPPRPHAPPGIGYRKWRPLGDAGAVAMDRTSSVGGEQSVRVAVGTDPHGIVQDGIAIARGRHYVGSVWINGDAGAKVQIELAWGERPGQRQAIPLPAAQAEWHKVPFTFTGLADTDKARFAITGTGSGMFRIDAPSLMPADNIDGWRADTTAIARSLDSGMWRLPGGNFLSNWDWHEALGDRDRRRPMFDHAWNAIQSNDIGMDEWIDLTRIIGVEPYVTVNAGLGDANSAAELVEYLNGSAETWWGSRRAANGHPEPYGVKYWNIGNEPYGDWQIGATTREYFMLKHREFADRMRRADPSIVLIGSGAMPDQRAAPGEPGINTIEDIKSHFGNERDWTFGLFDQAKGDFSGVTEHWYQRAEEHPHAPPDVELQEWTRAPQMQVRAKALQWGLYRERFPWIDKDGIFLWIDEYAYFGGPPNLKSALAYGMTLQEMLRYTDFLTGACFTTGASTMDITPATSALNSTGLVFKFYRQHFPGGSVPVAVAGNAPVPAPQYPQGAKHLLTVGGSPTYPLDVIAALAPGGKTLRIGVVNATYDEQDLALTVNGVRLAESGKLWVLTGSSLAAENRVGRAPQVTVDGPGKARRDRIEISPLSISVLEFPVAE